MNGIDAFVLLILGIGIFTGFRRGFIKSFAGFVGIGIAIWAGLNFSNLMEGFVAQYEAVPESVIKIVALILTIVLVFIALKIISRVIHTVVHTVGLGLINRLGGAVFSFILNAMVLSAIFYYFEPFLKEILEEETFLSSQTLPYLHDVTEFLKINLF